jgi:hypothetical protein
VHDILLDAKFRGHGLCFNIPFLSMEIKSMDDVSIFLALVPRPTALTKIKIVQLTTLLWDSCNILERAPLVPSAQT